jgi:hypothetical protein
MEDESRFPGGVLAERLPHLAWGAHEEGSPELCAMEAAAWLTGEAWSDNPTSVHPVVAKVARFVNDRVSDDERQTLWPLILASLDTTRDRHRIVRLRLSHRARRVLASARRHGDPQRAWRAVLAEHGKLYGPISTTASIGRTWEIPGGYRRFSRSSWG